MSRLRDWLNLVRLPNVFTAASDSLAGFLIAGANMDHAASAVLVCAASMALYGGGVTLNDVCDAALDARERPDRPIPSKRVTIATARRLAIVLLLVGVLAAWTASRRSAATALVLTGTIIAYNAALKTTIVGPVAMGMCRALNLVLGATVVRGYSEFMHDTTIVLACAGMLMYVSSLTFSARAETARIRRSVLATSYLGMLAAGGLAIAAVWPRSSPVAVGIAGGFELLLGMVSIKALLEPSFENVRRAVRSFVLMIPLLDFVLVLAVRDPAVAALVLVPGVIALALSRIRMA
jgi:4-hydroxybenzoate polyprenyltransferase